MMQEGLSVQGIVELASAYYGSAVLFAAVELGVFDAVEECVGEATLEELANITGHSRRGLRLLLDGCVASGLLVKQGDVYANTVAGKLALLRQGEHALGEAINYNRDVYTAWGKLAELVRSGRPVESPAIHLGDDLERTRRFALAMHGRALGIGRMVVPMLELAGCRCLLDLAGGPGTYARLLVDANPELRVVTVDLPAIAAVAGELTVAAGMSDRVECRAGDYHTDEYEAESYDVVTIFGALHQESPEMICSILRRAHTALLPGGRIFILDMMTDETHTAPSFSALFAINMALTTSNGWVFSDMELKGWLSECGFGNASTTPVPPPMPHWLVTAFKE